MPDIWVAGCPSFVGGADTELMHQIILWRKNNIDVHIVPNDINGVSKEIGDILSKLGCTIHIYEKGIMKDKVVVSYCNGTTLKRLPEFEARKFIWFNCMTWTFDNEIEAIKNKLITHLGFVSNYQKNYLIKEYSQRLPDMCVWDFPYNATTKLVEFGKNGFPETFDYNPYLDLSMFEVLKKNYDYIGLGRISRADPAKFSSDCWRIFDRVLYPKHKKVFILGFSDQVAQKIGQPPPGLDWQWWTAGSIPVKELFSKIDIMIHKTGGSRESYCRVLIEAMAHGIVPLVENDFAFPEILGKTDDLKFLMCNSSDEMSFKASIMAFNTKVLDHYKAKCREYVEKHLVDEAICIKPWLELLG